MKRTFVLFAALLFASALPASPQATDKTMLLLQRVAAQNGGRADVLVGKVFADMPKVPLPDATLIGTVHRTRETLYADTGTYDLFYDAATTTVKGYESALAAAGWMGQDIGGGGFVSSSGAGVKAYCKANAPFIMLWTGEDPSDFRVSVSGANQEDDVNCDPRQIRSPLPELHAPQGATMSLALGSYTFSGGRSTARIHNGSSATALLDAFAAQMASDRWQLGVRSSAVGIASQSFSKTDSEKVQWQCMIVVSAMAGTPSDFLALVDSERTGR
jgi:hypothetical protein